MIRERSHDKQSLDDGMLALLHEAAQKEIVLTDAFLATHFSAYVGSDAKRDIQRFVEDGETIPFLNAQPAAGGARIH